MRYERALPTYDHLFFSFFLVTFVSPFLSLDVIRHSHLRYFAWHIFSWENWFHGSLVVGLGRLALQRIKLR